MFKFQFFRNIYFLIFILVGTLYSFVPIDKKGEPPFAIASPWADSIIKTLSSEERIAQLFMVAAYSNKDKAHVTEIKKLIVDYKIGGLIFFQGGPARQAILTNTYQSVSKVPLLLSIATQMQHWKFASTVIVFQSHLH